MVDPKLARAYGTLAGFGFIGVALLGIPGALLLEPPPEREAFFVTLAAALTGIVCLAFPWDMLDPRWLHAIGVAAIVEAAASVAVFGSSYVALFFLIAVFAAYFAPTGRVLAGHLGLICVALFAPIVYGPEDARSALSVALVTTPVLLLTAGLFAYLRQKMVHDRLAYHRFAEQTLELSSQIAGRPLGPPRLVHDAVPALPFLTRIRPPKALLAGVAAIVALPLFAGGLAVAGVKLPAVATDPFERLGIELPNQEDQEEDGGAATELAGPAEGVTGPRTQAPAKSGDEPRRNADGGEPTAPGSNKTEADEPGTAPAPAAPAAPATPSAAPPDAPAGASGPTDEPASPDETEEPATPIKDLLEQAGEGIGDLITGLDGQER
jgi:hypothetical protein